MSNEEQKDTKEYLKVIKEKLSGLTQKFGKAKLASGESIEWQGELAEGVEVNKIDEDGERKPVPNGDHELEDGRVISVEDGKISGIEQPEDEEEESEESEQEAEAESDEEEEVEMAEAELVDGGKVVYEGELGEGTELFVIDEEGERKPAPEGKHELMSGVVVAVDADGKVVAVKNTLEQKVDEKFNEYETQLQEIAKTLSDLTNSHADALEVIEKLSKEPAVEEESKTVSNNFNKTKTKSRAAQILASDV